jgi:hypothetical protein
LLIVVVAGELVRNHRVVVERPQQFVERFGFGEVAGENQRRLLRREGLPGQLAGQQ